MLNELKEALNKRTSAHSKFSKSLEETEVEKTAYAHFNFAANWTGTTDASTVMAEIEKIKANRQNLVAAGVKPGDLNNKIKAGLEDLGLSM